MKIVTKNAKGEKGCITNFAGNNFWGRKQCVSLRERQQIGKHCFCRAGVQGGMWLDEKKSKRKNKCLVCVYFGSKNDRFCASSE